MTLEEKKIEISGAGNILRHGGGESHSLKGTFRHHKTKNTMQYNQDHFCCSKNKQQLETSIKLQVFLDGDYYVLKMTN